jgi:phosphate butyryltransferase
MLTSHAELRAAARRLGPLRVAVVDADDDVALSAVALAAEQQIASVMLVGNEARIRERVDRLSLGASLQAAEYVATDTPAIVAAQLASEGRADILLKGHLRTDEMMRAVLDKSLGLRTGRLLSDVLLYEDVLSGKRRLVGITDGGLNVAPDLAQKKQIVLNAIEVLRRVGIARPKIAILSATEAVSSSVPSTVDAQALTEMGRAGEFGDADVFGPLALDNALLESAAQAKGITHPVAGHADCMVVANIEAGNALAKAAKYMGGSSCAHVVVGARMPILIPSRVESAEDKLNAIALGVLVAGR